MSPPGGFGDDADIVLKRSGSWLRNAFRHAEASRVLVELDFGKGNLRLSVSDDGIGLPDDYAERGHGFANMGAGAGRLGGRLIVERRGSSGGASVTCVMQLEEA